MTTPFKGLCLYFLGKLKEFCHEDFYGIGTQAPKQVPLLNTNTYRILEGDIKRIFQESINHNHSFPRHKAINLKKLVQFFKLQSISNLPSAAQDTYFTLREL